MNQINQEKIILASQSPRREYLLSQAGLTFEILAADIDENALALTKDPATYAQTLSKMKADHIGKSHPRAWIIGADTIVVVDNTILGKPQDRGSAITMLTALNNKPHSVITGFTVCHPYKQIFITKSVETRVVFKDLTNEEIQWYTATNEPYDKAGGYGIQGIGAFMVRQITGSYSNVVGLPMCEIIETMSDLEIIQF